MGSSNTLTIILKHVRNLMDIAIILLDGLSMLAVIQLILIEEVGDDTFHSLVKSDILLLEHRVERAVRWTSWLIVAKAESVQKVRVDIFGLFVEVIVVELFNELIFALIKVDATITNSHGDLHDTAHVTLLAYASHNLSLALIDNSVARDQAISTSLSILVNHRILKHGLLVGVVRPLELTDLLVHRHETWVVFADESTPGCLSVS